MISDVELIARLLLSLALGGAVGLERERRGREAGLRTLMLVALGSTLFTIVSIYGFQGSDPARIAAQIVSGIGFIGAGIVLQQGQTIRGVTTAASVWAVAAVGIAVGTGMYVVSIVATIIVTMVLWGLRELERRISRGEQQE